MSYQVEIPETNTHHHTHKPEIEFTYFIDGYLSFTFENIFNRFNINDSPTERTSSK